MHLILEGHLEESVAEKLLAYCGHEKGTVYGRQGFGYIQTKAAKFHPLATETEGVLVLSDFMDSRAPCPRVRLKNTSSSIWPTRPKRFCAALPLQNWKSWLLADRKRHGRFFENLCSKHSLCP